MGLLDRGNVQRRCGRGVWEERGSWEQRVHTGSSTCSLQHKGETEALGCLGREQQRFSRPEAQQPPHLHQGARAVRTESAGDPV